jgi:hypothetical protein
MIVYFSGGSSIPETQINEPALMPSYYVNVDPTLADKKKKNKPDARFRKMMVARIATKKSKKKGK